VSAPSSHVSFASHLTRRTDRDLSTVVQVHVHGL
jgi:hypothetical protein